MWTREGIIEKLRPKLVALIAHEKVRIGCQMQAVKRVAKRVGASEHWVRRVTGRYGEVSIHGHLLLNILTEYVKMRRAVHRAARAQRAAQRSETMARVHYGLARIKTRLTGRQEARA